jgi:hypothetical protein
VARGAPSGAGEWRPPIKLARHYSADPLFAIPDGIEMPGENLLSLRYAISTVHTTIIEEDLRYCLKLQAVSAEVMGAADVPNAVTCTNNPWGGKCSLHGRLKLWPPEPLKVCIRT